MNYIGSKLQLCDFIKETIEKTLLANNDKRRWEELIFADLFAGTGIVGSSFKRLGCQVISNDLHYYSYCLIKALIENNKELEFKGLVREYPELKNIENKLSFIINILESLEGEKGFIYNNYCLGGTQGKEFERVYFSDENGMKCDAIRSKIEEWKEKHLIEENEYFYLISILLEGIDQVANTASVYGAFLKKIKKSAAKPLQLKELIVNFNNKENKVYNDDINDLILRIEGDVLYLDPPYNHRQYSSNYHILETIAKYDEPIIMGKTGLRDYSYQKSKYCSKVQSVLTFEHLVKNAKFKYIFLSYNCEGIIPIEKIKEIMSCYGKYSVYEKEHKRFKADKTEARNHKAQDKTTEYIHCLIKEAVANS